MAFIDTYFKEVEQRFAVMKQEREPLEQAARLLFEAEKEHHTIYTFGRISMPEPEGMQRFIRSMKSK